MFEKIAFGLDIADHTIEVAKLRRSFFSRKMTVLARQRISLEHGIVEHGTLRNRKKLSESLSSLWDLLGTIPQSVVFGLPERQVYTAVLHFPGTEPSREMITDHAAKTVPLEKDDLSFSYKVIARSSNGVDVLMYGASREVMNDWHDFFESVGIVITAFDHELLAIGRGLFGADIPHSSCIVDIGAERTKIAIFTGRGLEYVHAIDSAGDFFTREIAKILDLSIDTAEKMKRDEGMQPVSLAAPFAQFLEPIISEIRTAVRYAQETIHDPISDVVLVGGSAQLKGLPAYLSEQLQLPVRLGGSFLLSKQVNGSLEQLHYIEAIGLALKGLDQVWERRHPSLS